MISAVGDILLTGFEAFGEHQRNPSADVLRECPAVVAGLRLHTAVLPVSYRRAPEALEQQLRKRPWRAVVLLGLAGQSSAWRIETLARNCNGETPDNDGIALADSPVLAEAPAMLNTSLPVEALQQSLLAQGLPVELSEDAGGYLCNYMFFRLMAWQQRYAPELLGGFVHVPPVASDASANTGWEAHRRALAALLDGLSIELRKCVG